MLCIYWVFILNSALQCVGIGDPVRCGVLCSSCVTFPKLVGQHKVCCVRIAFVLCLLSVQFLAVMLDVLYLLYSGMQWSFSTHTSAPISFLCRVAVVFSASFMLCILRSFSKNWKCRCYCNEYPTLPTHMFACVEAPTSPALPGN